MRCKVERGTFPEYRWFLNDSRLEGRGSFYALGGAHNSSLSLSVGRHSSGVYQCQASDTFDNTTTIRSLKILINRDGTQSQSESNTEVIVYILITDNSQTPYVDCDLCVFDWMISWSCFFLFSVEQSLDFSAGCCFHVFYCVDRLCHRVLYLWSCLKWVHHSLHHHHMCDTRPSVLIKHVTFIFTGRRYSGKYRWAFVFMNL